MAGLDKMLDQILAEANTKAAGVIGAAKAQAEQLMSEAERQAAGTDQQIGERSLRDIDSYKERIKSSADLKRRTALLKAKQEMIKDTIQKAYEEFCSVEGDAYYARLVDIAGKYARNEEGTMYLNKADLAGVPADFEAKVRAAAAARGGKLVLSGEARDIDNGFILSYGGIEENCSFKALFDAKKEELQDEVQRIVFS